MFVFEFVDGGKVLDNKNQNSIYLSKNNFFAQRLRRKARNIHRRYRRDDGNGGLNNPNAIDDEPQRQYDDQSQQNNNQGQQYADQN
jgi:hypothetical protein